MKIKSSGSVETSQTKEYPIVSNRRQDLLKLELRNRQIVDQNRRELTLIAQKLTTIADRITDNKTRASILNDLMPTARAVSGNVIPESMEIEIQNLGHLADKVASHVHDNDVPAQVAQVKSLVKNLLSNLPE